MRIIKTGLVERYSKNLGQGTNSLKHSRKRGFIPIVYKKAKYDAQKLIAAKKQAFFDEKLSERVGKPKELWNTLKSLGMPKKTVVSNFNAIDDNKSLTYDIKTMSKVFKDFFSDLAKSFLDKLPDPSNKYNLESVFLYYSNFAIPEFFHIKCTSEANLFKIMENIEISKASGIDKLPGRFLKDGAKILSKPIMKFAASRSLMEYFLMLAKLRNKNLFSRKAKKSTHLITGLSRYCH